MIKKIFLFDEGSHEDLSKKIKNRMNHLEFFEFNSNYDIVNTVKDFTFNCIIINFIKNICISDS